MNYLIVAIIVLGIIAILAAFILWLAAKRFAVKEDDRLGAIAELLPGANCGGCGFAGCKAFAEALVKGADNGSIDALNCPVGGNAVMSAVADKLGMAAGEKEPQVAVVMCNGSCEHRQRTQVVYDGLLTCRAKNACGISDTLCPNGCLGCGDCVEACTFGALRMNGDTLMPEVDDDLCTACGACVKACPKKIVRLRRKGPKGRRVYVACSNTEKGILARKACDVACIACTKCVKECKFDAITIDNNLSRIDDKQCRLCRKCVSVCPTHAIIDVGFPKSLTTTPQI